LQSISSLHVFHVKLVQPSLLHIRPSTGQAKEGSPLRTGATFRVKRASVLA
jgi:hypothetical protein